MYREKMNLRYDNFLPQNVKLVETRFEKQSRVDRIHIRTACALACLQPEFTTAIRDIPETFLGSNFDGIIP